MNTPERSAALAQALNSGVGLPDDFAAKVAALAEFHGPARTLRWNVGLVSAFAVMLGICVAGWISFAEDSLIGFEWVAEIIAALSPRPWLATGMAGIAFVQMLTFQRRTKT